ncbi:hypothetical protein E3N88_09119 [Mikania micrantha]|uniref:Uncharacterized protein n=1 Tax=Mikania micrantha TaxID=192012 RepID=A0A5N6PKG2_9ASTR|nr:hypothetical protein E3N88_09119 [Mikania micrantha]
MPPLGSIERENRVVKPLKLIPVEPLVPSPDAGFAAFEADTGGAEMVDFSQVNDATSGGVGDLKVTAWVLCHTIKSERQFFKKRKHNSILQLLL